MKSSSRGEQSATREDQEWKHGKDATTVLQCQVNLFDPVIPVGPRCILPKNPGSDGPVGP